MNILSEIIGEHILAENERRKDDPAPQSAFITFDALKAYVNTHQVEHPTEWRVCDYYKDVCDQCAYLREIQIPETLCPVYLVIVPRDHRQTKAYINHIPALSELVHSPELFGFSEELDLERRLQKPANFPYWELRYDSEAEVGIGWAHVEGWGLVADRRNNDCRVFAQQEDADAYVGVMKAATPVKTETERLADAAMSVCVGDTQYFNDYD